MSKLDNHAFYEEEVGDRVITVCAGVKEYSNHSSNIYIGIAIRHPVKEEREGLGEKIAKNRCISAMIKRKRIRNNKMLKVADIHHRGARNDKFLLQQFAKTYFYHVKHNLENYVAAYETN